MTSQALTLSSEVPNAHPWLDTEAYPFAVKRWTSIDGDLSYVDEGPSSGGTVLFVHGTPSWSFEFREVIKALRKTMRCVAPDHLGFGLSDKPRDAPYRPEDHARRLRALVEHLGLTDVTLVVHDFGGPIGLPLALDTPERIQRIIVLNSFMWSNGDDPEVQKIDRFVRSWLGRLLYLVFNLSPRVLLPASFGDRKSLTRALHQHYVRPFARRRERRSLHAMALALAGSNPFYENLWARRDELTDRINHIVWGERDPAFKARHLARWTQAFPNAQVVRLPEVGHFVAEEAPAALVDVLKR